MSEDIVSRDSFGNAYFLGLVKAGIQSYGKRRYEIMVLNKQSKHTTEAEQAGEI